MPSWKYSSLKISSALHAPRARSFPHALGAIIERLLISALGPTRKCRPPAGGSAYWGRPAVLTGFAGATMAAGRALLKPR
jgi:hypothetical protein